MQQGEWHAKVVAQVPEGGLTFQIAPPQSWGSVLTSMESGDMQFYGAWRLAVAEFAGDPVTWETPALSDASMTLPFEMTMYPATSLRSRQADPTPFQEHMRGHEQVAVFPNRDHSALLVSPSSLWTSGQPYSDLAPYLTNAQTSEVDELLL